MIQYEQMSIETNDVHNEKRKLNREYIGEKNMCQLINK